MITSLLLGIFIGSIQVGSVTWRMVQIINGKILNVLLASIFVSASYYVGIYFIIKDNLTAYIGFSIGAALATMTVARNNKKSLSDKEQNNG
jgi:hypothetical protein